MNYLGSLKWILDIIWPLNQHFKLKNQRNWLKQVWMWKFWNVINCILLHWRKKLTLASCFFSVLNSWQKDHKRFFEKLNKYQHLEFKIQTKSADAKETRFQICNILLNLICENVGNNKKQINKAMPYLLVQWRSFYAIALKS